MRRAEVLARVLQGIGLSMRVKKVEAVDQLIDRPLQWISAIANLGEISRRADVRAWRGSRRWAVLVDGHTLKTKQLV